VTACTGLDTLTHAVEAMVTRRRSPASCALAEEAFVLAERNLEVVLAAPDDLDARAAMLHASALAGLAIENSMLGAAHSMANPLSRRFGLPHGQAVGQALPWVVAYNTADADARSGYAALARAAGLAGAQDDDLEASSRLRARLTALVERAGFGPHLDAAPAGAAEELAAEAATQWTAQFNPRDVDAAAFAGLYRELLA
jgi:alcohol dehydrogenase